MKPQPNKDEKQRTHEARMNTAREVRAARATGASATPKAADDAPPLEYGDPPRKPLSRDPADPTPLQISPPASTPTSLPQGARPRNS
jgi:hypothetical protein